MALHPGLSWPSQPKAAAKSRLGQWLFEGVNLSEPSGQACATCHATGSGLADPDRRLGGVVGQAGQYGKFSVPTVRNEELVAETGALARGCWPRPEMVANVNSDELGHLRLSAREVDDIVAFMLRLTDGWQAPAGR